MKKSRHFAFFLFCFLIAFRTAYGQDSAYQYHDPATPQHPWIIESNWNALSLILIGLSERVTLPADSGYVDSVSIVFNGIFDTVHVLLVSDTLYTSTAGTFHLMNAFDPSAPIYAEAIASPPFSSGQILTVYFPHVRVPKEFHVLVAPSLYSMSVPKFRIVGDSEASRPRTADSSRSGFLALSTSTNQFLVEVLDSTLTPADDGSPLFSNPYITTYASEDPTGGTNETRNIGLTAAIEKHLSGIARSAALPEEVGIYPNPAAATVHFEAAEPISRVELLDLLGRTVLSQKLEGNGSLDVSRLAPGRYQAVITTPKGVVAKPVIVVR